MADHLVEAAAQRLREAAVASVDGYAPWSQRNSWPIRSSSSVVMPGAIALTSARACAAASRPRASPRSSRRPSPLRRCRAWRPVDVLGARDARREPGCRGRHTPSGWAVRWAWVKSTQDTVGAGRITSHGGQSLPVPRCRTGSCGTWPWSPDEGCAQRERLGPYADRAGAQAALERAHERSEEWDRQPPATPTWEDDGGVREGARWVWGGACARSGAPESRHRDQVTPSRRPAPRARAPRSRQSARHSATGWAGRRPVPRRRSRTGGGRIPGWCAGRSGR